MSSALSLQISVITNKILSRTLNLRRSSRPRKLIFTHINSSLSGFATTAGKMNIHENLEYYAQILPVIKPCPEHPEGKILLCRWKTGNYAGRYTGLIKSVKIKSFVKGKPEIETEVRPQLDEMSKSLLPSGTKEYLDKIELKGILRFDGPPDCDEYVYLANYKNPEVFRKYPSLEMENHPCFWFDWNKIPFDEMPADDAIWYPKILSGGQYIRGSFIFGGLQERTIKSYELFTVENL